MPCVQRERARSHSLRPASRLAHRGSRSGRVLLGRPRHESPQRSMEVRPLPAKLSCKCCLVGHAGLRVSCAVSRSASKLLCGHPWATSFIFLSMHAPERLRELAAFLLTPGLQLARRPDVAEIGPPDLGTPASLRSSLSPYPHGARPYSRRRR